MTKPDPDFKRLTDFLETVDHVPQDEPGSLIHIDTDLNSEQQSEIHKLHIEHLDIDLNLVEEGIFPNPGKAYFEEVISTVLNQKNKERSFYIIPVLAEVTDTESHDMKFVKIYSELLGGLVRNGTVLSEVLEKHGKQATVMDLSESVHIANYHKMLKETQELLTYDQAHHALWFGKVGITRKVWYDNNIFLTIYSEFRDPNEPIADPHPNLKICLNGNKKFSTGWTPVEEDKAATDWIIV